MIALCGDTCQTWPYVHSTYELADVNVVEEVVPSARVWHVVEQLPGSKYGVADSLSDAGVVWCSESLEQVVEVSVCSPLWY